MFDFPSLVPPLRFRRARPSLTVDFSVFWSAPNIFTYTRATTATVTDFEGLIKSCLSGELRIQGARRVYNELTFTETLSNAAWTRINNGTGSAPSVPTTGFTAPDGTTTAWRIQADRGAGDTTNDFSILRHSTQITGSKYRSVWVKSNTGSSQTFMLGSYSSTQTAITATTTWQRLASSNADSNFFDIANQGSPCTRSLDILVWHPQYESTVGQSNPNPSEYVPNDTGVYSSPFSGYFASGVKYFSYLNGNTVASNVVTEAQGAAITGTIGYLAEGARTNLCLQSQTFDNASWVKSNVTVVANQAVAPDGTTTADLVYPTTTGSNRQIVQTIAGSAAGSVTGCVYAKAAGLTWLLIGGVAAGQNVGVYFDLTNGVVGTQVIGVGTIEDVGDGWYRCSVLVTETDTTSYLIAGGVDADNTNNATTNGTDGVYLWAAQLEAGAFASTYIPTTTAAVARNADVLSAPSAGILNSAAMTIAMRWAPTAAGQGTVFLLGTYVDANNYTAILHDGTNIIARKRIAGVNADATKALAYVADTSYRITARFDSTNGCDIWVDGVKGTNDSTTTAAQVGTTFQIGCDGNSANHSFAVIPTFKAYRSGLSDAQAAAL